LHDPSQNIIWRKAPDNDLCDSVFRKGDEKAPGIMGLSRQIFVLEGIGICGD
jgi:hypothetical protein